MQKKEIYLVYLHFSVHNTMKIMLIAVKADSIFHVVKFLVKPFFSARCVTSSTYIKVIPFFLDWLL